MDFPDSNETCDCETCNNEKEAVVALADILASDPDQVENVSKIAAHLMDVSDLLETYKRALNLATKALASKAFGSRSNMN